MLRPRSLVDHGARHVLRGRTYQTRVSSAARPRGESIDSRLPTGGESLLRVVPILACCVVRVPVHGLERALRMKLGGRRDLDRNIAAPNPSIQAHVTNLPGRPNLCTVHTWCS